MKLSETKPIILMPGKGGGAIPTKIFPLQVKKEVIKFIYVVEDILMLMCLKRQKTNDK